MTMMEDHPYLERRTWRFTDTSTHKSYKFTGQLLGAATSKRREHTHSGEFVPMGEGPCHACRWFEVRIVVDVDTLDYVISYQGFTTLPDETHRHTVHRTRSPHTVIEMLTQVRNSEMFIPRTSRIALSEAAGRDEGIERAWIDRVVA